MRNLPGKYAEGVAKEAGEQTAEYVADNMQQNMQQNMDDMKEQARVCTNLIPTLIHFNSYVLSSIIIK